MNVLVAGDSWGEGVRDRGHQLHPGIQAFFQDYGHTAHNISIGGLSNTEICKEIARHLLTNSSPDILIVFWTCPLREWKSPRPAIQDIDSWCSQYWREIFNDLNAIISDKVIVISIGGLADIPRHIQTPFAFHMPSCGRYLMQEHHIYQFGDFNYVDRAFDSADLRYQVLDHIESKMKIWRQYQFKTMRSDAGHPSADGYRRIFENIPMSLYV